MPREYKLFLSDILKATNKVQTFTEGLTFEEFSEDELIIDAVVRNLEIIGEAVKRVPESITSKRPDVEWKKIAGLRDILIHAYFGLDMEIIWDLIRNEVPLLQRVVNEIFVGLS